MDAPLKFVAEISPVREVSLIGAADLAFWRERLRCESLFPAELDGLAQILVCGTDAKFHGIRFQELSISVFVSRHGGGSQRDGAWLPQAFNSNWFFAMVERIYFSTPYDHAKIEVTATLPAQVRVQQRGQIVLEAAMSEPGDAERKCIRCGNDGWEGPIFLPGGRTAPGAKWFYARIGGPTRVYPYLPDRDQLTIRPEHAPAALSWLLESGFAGRQWAIRDSAAHAKSKTYSRRAVEAFAAMQPALAAAE